MKVKIVASLCAALISSAVFAPVSVTARGVRAPVPQQKATGAFMQITSPVDAKLVEVRSPAAKVVEVHEMVMEKDVMKMRAIPGLDLPAGKAVELKPGGYHVMLINLNAQVKEGDMVPLTVVVEGKDGKRESVEINAPVRPLNSAAGGMQMHKMH